MRKTAGIVQSAIGRRFRAVVALVACMFGFITDGAADSAAFSVTLYDHGRQIQLTANQQVTEKIVALCAEQLSNANGVLRLAVTPQLIDDLKQRERTLEIVYDEPQSFVIAFNNNKFEASRLLIPLSGDYAANITTIFVGDAQYKHGPYRNSQGVANIIALVEQMGLSQ